MIATFNIEKYYTVIGDVFKDISRIRKSSRPRLTKIDNNKYIIDFMSGKLNQVRFILNLEINHKVTEIKVNVELDLFKYLMEVKNIYSINFSRYNFREVYDVLNTQASDLIANSLKRQIYVIEEFLNKDWSVMPQYLDCNIPKYLIYKYYLINYPIFVILKCIKSIF